MYLFHAVVQMSSDGFQADEEAVQAKESEVDLQGGGGWPMSEPADRERRARRLPHIQPAINYQPSPVRAEGSPPIQKPVPAQPQPSMQATAAPAQQQQQQPADKVS